MVTPVPPSTHQIRRTRVGEVWHVVVKGELNDQLSSALLHEGLDGFVVFDLDGLTRVTSYGVREWMRGLGKLRVDYFCFTNCRPAMVAQFNMIAGFGSVGELVSLYLPFVCDACDHEFEVPSTVAQDYSKFAGGAVPEAVCPSCGSASAEFDDLPNYYFSYVLSCRPPSTPAAVESFIFGDAETNPEATIEPRVRKVIRGRVTAVHLEGAIDRKVRLRRRLAGIEGLVLVDLSRVTSITDDVIRELHTFSDDPDVTRLDLSEVPQALGTQVCQSFPVTDSTSVVSFVVRGWCEACDSEQTGILRLVAGRRSTDSWATAPTVMATQCTTCLASLTPDLTGPELSECRQLLGRLPQAEIVNYLEYRSDEFSEVGMKALRASDMERLSAYRYEVVRRLDAGGMAEVFLANQRGPQGFQKDVALKRILPELSERKNLVEMFLREARIAAQISHPNVVQIFDLGRDAEGFYIAMEYVDGWNLGHLLRTAQRLGARVPVHIAVRIGSDICAGLEGAHSTSGSNGEPLGIVHRDVSQNNVLISRRGMVKVADFGVAAAALSHEEAAPGTIRGKVMYLAPELVREGPTVAGPASDIFAAGVVLYQTLSGRPLFRRDSDYETLDAILHDTITPLSEIRDDIPAELDAIVAKMLARSLDERCSSALEIHHDLERLQVQLGRVTTSTDIAEWAAGLMRAGKALEGGSRQHDDVSVSATQARRPAREDGVTPTLTQLTESAPIPLDLSEDETAQAITNRPDRRGVNPKK